MSVGHGATAGYKGDRNLRWSYEDSAGLIVPLEDEGQHNPHPMGRGPTSASGV